MNTVENMIALTCIMKCPYSSPRSQLPSKTPLPSAPKPAQASVERMKTSGKAEWVLSRNDGGIHISMYQCTPIPLTK